MSRCRVLHHVTVDDIRQVDEGVEPLELRLAVREPIASPPAPVVILVIFVLFVDVIFT